MSGRAGNVGGQITIISRGRNRSAAAGHRAADSGVAAHVQYRGHHTHSGLLYMLDSNGDPAAALQRELIVDHRDIKPLILNTLKLIRTLVDK